MDAEILKLIGQLIGITSFVTFCITVASFFLCEILFKLTKELSFRSRYKFLRREKEREKNLQADLCKDQENQDINVEN